MRSANTRLSLLPFVQSYDGGKLGARLLMLPSGNPLSALDATNPAGDSFATAPLQLSVVLTSGLAAMPPLGVQTVTSEPSPAPPQAEELFEALAAEFNIDPAPAAAQPRRASTNIKKYLPPSYRVASGLTRSRTPFAVTDDSFCCTRKTKPVLHKLPDPAAPIPWGKVIAAALRQPVLAEALGLIRPLVIAVPAGALDKGGWLHVALDAADDAGLGGTPGSVAVYAARIGPLTLPRRCFSPVLFPVPPSGAASYDEPFAEAVDYADGFAKVVHASQQRTSDPLGEKDDGTRPVKETGIRLGWDDEQVTIWLNRQIDPGLADQDAPMGVRGFRLDARTLGDPAWHSLCRASGPVSVGAAPLGNFDGELNVETHPVQLDAQTTGDFWLAPYFTRWTGASLVGDPVALQLAGHPAPAGRAGVVAANPDVSLTYGTSYEFRVRLADHTGGGPETADDPTVPGPAPVTVHHFRRWVRPGQPQVERPAVDDATAIVVRRPRLGWPAYPCTGVPGALADLLTDLPVARAAGREVGLPDPDVAAVEVTVQVRWPAFDPDVQDRWRTVYTTSRPFPADLAEPLTLALAWTDAHDVAGLGALAAGPLPLPTSRDLRVELRALGREDAALVYFGADDVRRGALVSVLLRKEADDETGLLLPAEPAEAVRGVFLQPSPPADPTLAYATRAAGQSGQPGDEAQRLSASIELIAHDATLRGRPGRRTVFSCAAGVRHVIGPDAGSLTIATQIDLARQWLVCLRVTLDRDWSWDGLAPAGIAVMRDGNAVGQIQMAASLAGDAVLADPDRSQVDLVFIDAVDGKPPVGEFPRPLDLTYHLVASFRSEPAAKDDPLLELPIELPATTPPTQVPRLISAGIALSPYVHSDDYSSTDPRRRMIWLEFDRATDDPQDSYFSRVLRAVPDPLLLGTSDDTVPEEPVDPPLPVDPEWTRVIVPGQSDDRAGIGAMQRLLAGDSPTHFLLPLPPGVHEGDPELLGFFTYEFRVGHDQQWSTAQGRFGAALRVTGLQHPAPTLTCSVRRLTTGIVASAPYAGPVFQGVSLRPRVPATRMWILLYAQVIQADATTWRNVLLGRKPAPPRNREDERRPQASLYGVAAWNEFEAESLLLTIGLGSDAPLSCLAVEVLPGGVPAADPLGADLGHERILRASPLVPIPELCQCG
jgi:hypothetical protein